MRADSGFYQQKLLDRLSAAKVGYSVTIHQRQPVRAAIDAIEESAWWRIDYPDGHAHVAECVYRGRRLIVRRVPSHRGAQGQLFPTWRYHAFVTNLAGPAWSLDAQHRAHAVVELSIRDLKAGPLAHLPSGSFNANSAWLQCAVLAHNLIRWAAVLGERRHRPAHRSQDVPHPAPRHPRPPRQPLRPAHPPPPRPLALGPALPPSARHAARPARPSQRLSPGTAARRTAHDARADNAQPPPGQHRRAPSPRSRAAPSHI